MDTTEDAAALARATHAGQRTYNTRTPHIVAELRDIADRLERSPYGRAIVPTALVVTMTLSELADDEDQEDTVNTLAKSILDTYGAAEGDRFAAAGVTMGGTLVVISAKRRPPVED